MKMFDFRTLKFMRHIHRSILLLICLLAFFKTSYSCICVQLKLEDEIEKSDLIFVGELFEIIEDQSYVAPKFTVGSSNLQKTIDRIAATTKKFFVKFKVKEHFKGSKDKEIIFVQYRSESPCLGIYFDKAKTYLVYAYNNEEDSEFNERGICSRSQNFDKNSKDYKELVKLKREKSSIF